MTLLLAMPLTVLAGLVLIFVWTPALNADERRLVGTWTYQEDPGHMVLDFRPDGTMLYDHDPFDGRPAFTRWWIEDGVLYGEYSSRNALRTFAVRHILRATYTTDSNPIHFLEDGTVRITTSDGTQRILIPWHGEQAQRLKRAR
ncbi:MAG: hypothetical protein R3C19_14685 [Planctomycetaceae bacterium]